MSAAPIVSGLRWASGEMPPYLVAPGQLGTSARSLRRGRAPRRRAAVEPAEARQSRLGRLEAAARLDRNARKPPFPSALDAHQAAVDATSSTRRAVAAPRRRRSAKKSTSHTSPARSTTTLAPRRSRWARRPGCSFVTIDYSCRRIASPSAWGPSWPLDVVGGAALGVIVDEASG